MIGDNNSATVNGDGNNASGGGSNSHRHRRQQHRHRHGNNFNFCHRRLRRQQHRHRHRQRQFCFRRHGDNNTATVDGNDSLVNAGIGDNNAATVNGNFSYADARGGDNNTATVDGDAAPRPRVPRTTTRPRPPVISSSVQLRSAMGLRSIAPRRVARSATTSINRAGWREVDKGVVPEHYSWNRRPSRRSRRHRDERTVTIGMVTYADADGRRRIGQAGETVDVPADDVARFDRINGTVPEAKPAPKKQAPRASGPETRPASTRTWLGYGCAGTKDPCGRPRAAARHVRKPNLVPGSAQRGLFLSPRRLVRRPHTRR